MPKRCGWVKWTTSLRSLPWWMGTPLHTIRPFELLCMETYQAGLSWERKFHNGRKSVRLFMGTTKAVADMIWWRAGRLCTIQQLSEIEPRFLRHGRMPSLLQVQRNLTVWCLPLVFCRWENHRQWCFVITVKHQLRRLLSEKLSKDLVGLKFTGPVAVLSYLLLAGLSMWSWECLWMENGDCE